MTDARRNDLNYGHFGEPVYDVELQEWQFTRQVEDGTCNPPFHASIQPDISCTAPQLHSLGESRLLIPPQLSKATSQKESTSAKRKFTINKLVQAYPDLAPSSVLLPSLAENSEAVQQNSAAYDPATSDLLALGRALHPRHRRNRPKRVPVIAVPGGAAGELVRIIQLVPEIIGWDDESSVKLKDEILYPKVQGLWSGNGSNVQQLQFAEINNEPTEWLAVRHGGSITILRVILREREIPTLFRLSYFPAIDEDVEFLLELEHIHTLIPQHSGGMSYADVCFNPWNPFEFAVVDQASQWRIWRNQAIQKRRNVWTLVAGLSGQLDEDVSEDSDPCSHSNSKHDGWAAVKWISDGTGVVVCNRKSTKCFELRDPPGLTSAFNLGLKKSKAWILDIKQIPRNPDHFFITTSSRLFYVRLSLAHAKDQEEAQFSTKILCSWVHFRNEVDLSLTMCITELGSSIFLPYHQHYHNC